MEALMNFLNPTGFLIAAMGTFIGYLSWKGTKDTDRMIEDGHSRLQKSLDEGNARLQATLEMMERNREEGNKRLELILSNMQQRWDQSDEFNKRMLDKILDRVA
jgi:F0F1-type ATP synthase membrane subunit b/b'